MCGNRESRALISRSCGFRGIVAYCSKCGKSTCLMKRYGPDDELLYDVYRNLQVTYSGRWVFE